MRFARCPKCGHSPLPQEQALPAACPACGLILAKYGSKPRPPAASVDSAGEDARDGDLPGRLAAMALYVPESVPRSTWIARAIVLAAFGAWTLWILVDMDVRGGSAGSTFLHMILLPFHEAGHYFLFRWFGDFIMTLGGTLGQHLLPVVFGVALLWKHRDPFGAAICLWMLGFSTIDMAVYMYDAFDPKLMLLGGRTGAESDGHDWQNLFGDMGLLPRARGIGRLFGFAGALVMLGALAWAAWLLRLQRARLDTGLRSAP